MLLRFKLVAGGKINLVAANVVAFTENENGTSTVVMSNDLTYEIDESAQAIRGAFKRLNRVEATEGNGSAE